MISLGLIGCGLIVRGSHIEAYKEIMEKDPNLFEIVAICDIQEENARNIAGQIAAFQKGKTIKVYTDYSSMLKAESLDAVTVATPHFAHHEPSICALNSGVHVAVEKPFAITVKAGQKMVNAAEKSKCILACVEPIRRNVHSRMIDWAINKARLIGDMRFFLHHEVRYDLGVVVGTPWRHQKIMAGGGWVFDGEVHYIDFLRMVFGDVTNVYAKIRNFEPTRYLDWAHGTGPKTKLVQSDVEDTSFAIITFRSGLIGSFIWTAAAVEEPVAINNYYGSEGSLVSIGEGFNIKNKRGNVISSDDLHKRFMESLRQDEKKRLFPLEMTNPNSIAFYDFFDSIINKRIPEISGREALAAQAICDAILESDAIGQEVTIKDIMEGHIDTYQREIDDYWKI
jgi:predicted dehydrogenase